MGFPKKMEWLKWIRKYSTGILDTKTGSMETLIDSGSSKIINYAYTSSVISDDEFVKAVAVATPQQRPMLPPPQTSDNLPSPPSPQLPNDVYDCCVSLDGIPIKHEFQYTLSDTEGYGKITKHDIEGLASKILESMYGTTAKLSSRGRRTVKVTLNIRPPSSSTIAAGRTPSPLKNHHLSDGHERERRYRSSLMSNRQRGGTKAAVLAESMYTDTGCPIYVVSGSESQYRGKTGAQRYRHDQLIEMVQRSLAENLSFQNQRKSDRPEACEDYYRPRTKRRQAVTASAVSAMQATPLPSPPTSKSRPQPAKVAWSPYDFEPVAHVPSNNHHFHEQLKNLRNQQQQKLLYGGNHVEQRAAVKSSRGHGGGGGGGGGGRHRQHRNAGTAVISGNNAKQPKNVADEHTKNTDHQRYKRAKLASKKIHHHIHEHHHYHHYDYYIV